jgi:hypothetical protein
MNDLRIFVCRDCGNHFQAPHGAGRPTNCPACNSNNFHRTEEERGTGPGRGRDRCRRGGQGRGQPVQRRARRQLRGNTAGTEAPLGPAAIPPAPEDNA